MSKYTGKTTTELFNIFHDGYKDIIASLGPDNIPDQPHWCKEFRVISGISKEDTDACYWENVMIPNNEEANVKLCAFLDKIDKGEDVVTAASLFADITGRYGVLEIKDGKYLFTTFSGHKDEYDSPEEGCLDLMEYVFNVCKDDPDEHIYSDEQLEYLKNLAKLVEAEGAA